MKTCSGDCKNLFNCSSECYLKKDIDWAFDTFIKQLKESKSISSQAVRYVERIWEQINKIVPTYEYVGNCNEEKKVGEDGKCSN